MTMPAFISNVPEPKIFPLASRNGIYQLCQEGRRVHVAEEENRLERMKASENMIASFNIFNHLNFRAKFARFFGNNCTDAVNRGFIVGRRFGLNQDLEKRD